jgi:hypothetical protein
VTTGRALLPLARNALKKLRTLRHPGVIKVFDTVEVRIEASWGNFGGTEMRTADRHVYLHCYGTAGASQVACFEAKHHTGDCQMGLIHHSGKHLELWWQIQGAVN